MQGFIDLDKNHWVKTQVSLIIFTQIFPTPYFLDVYVLHVNPCIWEVKINLN